jgi:RNA recognition motif-containing protein
LDNGPSQAHRKQPCTNLWEAKHHNEDFKESKNKQNLFVGGLAWQTTEHSVLAYFQRFGPLEKVVVMHGRGFGFVLFKHSNDAEGVLKHTDPHVVDKKIVE